LLESTELESAHRQDRRGAQQHARQAAVLRAKAITGI
jgi:hypothetical protein